MPLPVTIGAVVRADIQAASDHLKKVELNDPEPLYCLVNASYEFNRGCSVSAFRAREQNGAAGALSALSDLHENFRLLLASEFEKVTDEDSVEEIVNASKEILLAVQCLPVIAPTEPPPAP